MFQIVADRKGHHRRRLKESLDTLWNGNALDKEDRLL